MVSTFFNLEKFILYIRLMRLDKPIGIFLLLWPTLMALWIAGKGKPPLFIVTIFILEVIIMRSAGCVINDLIDRGFDKQVTRTQTRPLATNALRVKEALLLFFLLLITALILVLTLNFLTIELSVIGLALAIFYPFMKRYTYFPQVVLGIAFGWSIPLAFSALSYPISSEAILLFLANLCWTIAYDTEYALMDRLEDIQIGVKSTAIRFGQADRMLIMLLQGSALLFFGMLGYQLKCGLVYSLGLLGAALLMAYQQYLIKGYHKQLCFKAFLNNNWVGALLFTTFALDYYLNNA